MSRNTRNYILLANFAFIYGSVWFFLNSPQMIIRVLTFLIASFCLESFIIIRKSKINDSWWKLAIFPCVSAIALLLSLTVLADYYFIQILSLATSALISTYWKKVYLFFHEPRRYRLGSLEYLADYGNIYAFFLISISFFGFRNYLETSFWFLIPSIIMLTALQLYNFYWSIKLQFTVFWPYLAVSTLIVCQIIWAISLLPFTFIDSALLITVFYYCLTHLQKLHLQAKLTSEKIRYYLVFISLSFILIFLSARWL